jgi:hypothetical protein
MIGRGDQRSGSNVARAIMKWPLVFALSSAWAGETAVDATVNLVIARAKAQADYLRVSGAAQMKNRRHWAANCSEYIRAGWKGMMP